MKLKKHTTVSSGLLVALSLVSGLWAMQGTAKKPIPLVPAGGSRSLPEAPKPLPKPPTTVVPEGTAGVGFKPLPKLPELGKGLVDTTGQGRLLPDQGKGKTPEQMTMEQLRYQQQVELLQAQHQLELAKVNAQIKQVGAGVRVPVDNTKTGLLVPPTTKPTVVLTKEQQKVVDAQKKIDDAKAKIIKKVVKDLEATDFVLDRQKIIDMQQSGKIDSKLEKKIKNYVDAYKGKLKAAGLSSKEQKQERDAVIVAIRNEVKDMVLAYKFPIDKASYTELALAMANVAVIAAVKRTPDAQSLNNLSGALKNHPGQAATVVALLASVLATIIPLLESFGVIGKSASDSASSSSKDKSTNIAKGTADQTPSGTMPGALGKEKDQIWPLLAQLSAAE